jgi:hypothetical protein
MAEKGPTESLSEDEARERITRFRLKELPRIVIDFPMRGIPEEINFPPGQDQGGHRSSARP